MMRKGSTILALLLLAALDAALAATAGAAHADFSGRWALDAGRSSGLPPGFDETLVVTQDGDTMQVASTLVTDARDRIVEYVWTLGAGEQDVPPSFPGITAKVSKRTARWTGDRSLEVTDHVEGEGGGGPVTVDVVRQLQLAENGQTIVVEQEQTVSGFTSRSHRVFTHAAPGSAVPPIAARMFPVDLRVPMPPTPFHSGGKTQLVYEVHATSLRFGDLDWKRLDVLDAAGRTLASYEGKALADLLLRPGATGGEPQRIPAGTSAVAFVWLALDGAPPAALRHRATFGIPASAAAPDRVVEGAPVAVRQPALVLGPPVRGGDWIARWTGNGSFHRRGLMAVDGGARISQRFAIDWNREAPDGHEWTGKGDRNEQYAVFGQDVIAVADAEVARVVDGIPLNQPGSLNPAVTVGVDTAAGDSVSLRLPDGSYAVYAHLQPGSIVVKQGQRVRRGEVLGKIGNSGNATGPHLHFHVSSGPGLEGDGLPYAFDAFTVVGTEEGMPADDGKWNGKRNAPREVRGEMPEEHMLVRFADGR